MDSGQVTLIFRQLEKKWTDEYALNILAALATNSNFSHVEVAIGDDAGTEGQMSNVLRIFNDAVLSSGARLSRFLFTSRLSRFSIDP